MPGYQTKQQSIAVHGVDDLEISSLLDHHQYSDPDGEAGRLGISSAQWPLFGLPWPSGAHLAARIAQRPVTAGERILELGCGLGLASLVAHRRGADVTASDCHPRAQAFLAANVLLNQLLPLKYRRGSWGAGAAIESAEARVSGRFDLIMASDVLYERDPDGDLAGYIALHAAVGAEVWIVDPDRGNHAHFNRHMREHGFAVHERRLDTAASHGRAAYKGRMWSFRR